MSKFEWYPRQNKRGSRINQIFGYGQKAIGIGVWEIPAERCRFFGKPNEIERSQTKTVFPCAIVDCASQSKKGEDSGTFFSRSIVSVFKWLWEKLVRQIK